jgi:hypothetical protein
VQAVVPGEALTGVEILHESAGNGGFAARVLDISALIDAGRVGTASDG